MTTFALASEYPRLTAEQRQRVDHLIIDDGDWTEAQIAAYINQWSAISPDPLPNPLPEEWHKPEPLV